MVQGSPPEPPDHISASFEGVVLPCDKLLRQVLSALVKKAAAKGTFDGTKSRCCRCVTVTNDQRSGIAAKQPNSRHVVS
jgi:hypothetical protein